MKVAKTTNVLPTHLNYDRYRATRYDRDIVNAIPFHQELHERIAKFVTKRFGEKTSLKVLDLGAGTGLSSAVIRAVAPLSEFTIVDFSKQMLTGARQRLGKTGVRYIQKDYALFQFPEKYDLIVSVIGLHHQTTAGFKHLVKKIFAHLKPGGVFILGDLMTYRDKRRAATNNARHLHHLVNNAKNERALADWAYHHLFLNDLKTIEDQRLWLKKAGFRIEKQFIRFNTGLLISSCPWRDCG